MEEERKRVKVKKSWEEQIGYVKVEQKILEVKEKGMRDVDDEM